MSYDCMVENACAQVTTARFYSAVQDSHRIQRWEMLAPALGSVCCQHGGRRRLYLQPAEPLWISDRVNQTVPQIVLQD